MVEHLLGAIAQRIRQSLDLETILNSTVNEVRQFLQTDRVLIYQFMPDMNGVMAVESVIAPWQPVLGTSLYDPCFAEQYVERYQQGHIHVVNDLYKQNLAPCYIELLAQFQVRANLVVPIATDDKLWGLLIAHHCRGARHWRANQIELLKQLGNQVAIAVQQAELHQQVQQLNAHLEQQIQDRTAELQQALKSEGLMRRIIEKIRDSLDETYILQTVVRELAQLLHLKRCKIDLYDDRYTTATTVCEYTTEKLSCQGDYKTLADFPELYEQLLQGQSVQFLEITPVLNPRLKRVTRLACPIFDERGIIGNLWLIRPQEESFSEAEMNLVQQVSNSCAIAIRQARLYEESQAQVEELEKLDRLKNEFLSTISHELRTPISAINLAAQTLEAILLPDEAPPQLDPETVQHLLQVLNRECQRESKLINDLLTLTYLDAETEPLAPVAIDLQLWLPALVDGLQDRAVKQKHQLKTTIAPNLPPLHTDITYLERILTELLSNAFKYTPEGETITLLTDVVERSGQHTGLSNAANKAATNDVKQERIKLLLINQPEPRSHLRICVSNTGAEIPEQERDRIFDAFYRIPNADPWKYGGTGLGLALVRKLAKRLGATVDVSSSSKVTEFTLLFPLPIINDSSTSS